MNLNRILRRFNLFSLMILGTALFCCDEHDAPLPEPVNQTAADLLEVEELTTEIESYVRGIWAYGNTYPNCAIVSHSNVEFGGDIWFQTTIRYAPGTRCADGHTRSGQVVMRRRVANREESVVRLEEYHVDGLKLEGTFTMLQLDEPGKSFALTTAVQDGKISGGDAATQFRLSRKSFWNEGTATPTDFSDDITEVFAATYSIDPTAGPLVQGTLVQPLIWKRGCQAQAAYRPVQGTIRLAWSDGKVSDMDFGGGDCNAQPDHH